MSRRRTAEGSDGYVRVSDVGKRKAEDDGTGYQSPDDQRRRIKATAARHGVALSGVFAVEEDVSGKLRAQKRSVGHLVERVERGESAGIIVADLDRPPTTEAEGRSRTLGPDGGRGRPHPDWRRRGHKHAGR